MKSPPYCFFSCPLLVDRTLPVFTYRVPHLYRTPASLYRSTLEFAKSQLEWMNEALVRSLGHSGKDSPFATR